MKEFAPLDILLSVIGCRMFAETRGARIVNRVLLVLMLTACVAVFIESTIRINSSKEPLLLITAWSDAFFGSVFVAVMAMKRQRLRDVLLDSRFLSDNQRSSLWKHALSFLLLKVTISLESIVSLAFHLQNRTLDHILLDLLTSYTTLNPWFLGGIGIYTFFIKVISFREECYFDDLMSRLVNLTGEAGKTQALAHDYRLLQTNLILERRSITRFRTDVLSAFSFIPCLWFAFIFARIGMVYENGGLFDSLVVFAINVEGVLILVLSISYLVNVCEHLASRTKDRTNELIDSLTQTGALFEMPAFVSELERSSDVKVTVWSAFDINRRFALSFLASMITFTVLLIQLASAWRQKSWSQG